MNDITVITPPDVLNNDVFSILAINPSEIVKENLNSILLDSDIPINLFLYEDEYRNIDWLINHIKKVDIILIDIDNSDAEVRMFTTFILAQPNTFFLTKDVTTPYNLINKHQVFDLAWLAEMINNRGNNGKL